MSELAVVHPKLTTDEARALTNEIRTDMFGLPQKILRAHDGEVWTALGYATFKEWAEKEYPHGIRRVYQLLNYARVERTIGSLPNERQARPLIALAGQPEQQREVFAAAQASAAAAGEKLTAAHIETEVAKATGKPKPKRNGAAPEPPPHAPGTISDAELDAGDGGDPVYLIDFNAEHASPEQLEEAISHLFGRLAPRKQLLAVVRLYHELDEVGRGQFNGLLEASK